MPKSIVELEQEASHLPMKDPAALAHHLITSAHLGEDVDAEAAWLGKAERRYQGKMADKPAEQVFREAKSKLR